MPKTPKKKKTLSFPLAFFHITDVYLFHLCCSLFKPSLQEMHIIKEKEIYYWQTPGHSATADPYFTSISSKYADHIFRSTPATPSLTAPPSLTLQRHQLPSILTRSASHILEFLSPLQPWTIVPHLTFSRPSLSHSHSALGSGHVQLTLLRYPLLYVIVLLSHPLASCRLCTTGSLASIPLLPMFSYFNLEHLSRLVLPLLLFHFKRQPWRLYALPSRHTQPRDTHSFLFLSWRIICGFYRILLRVPSHYFTHPTAYTSIINFLKVHTSYNIHFFFS